MLAGTAASLGTAVASVGAAAAAPTTTAGTGATTAQQGQGLNLVSASAEDLKKILANVSGLLGIQQPQQQHPQQQQQQPQQQQQQQHPQAGGGQGQGGWQTHTHGGRCPGVQRMGYQRRDDRGAPFQVPGAPRMATSKGYHDSTADRNRSRLQVQPGATSTATAALSREQWTLMNANLCIGCGGIHKAWECAILTQAEARALVKAAISCPPDMRPGGGSSLRGSQQQHQHQQAIWQQQQRERQRQKHLQNLKRQGPRPVAATSTAAGATAAVAAAAAGASASRQSSSTSAPAATQGLKRGPG